jgi:dephospho-CoA kinase
MDAKVIGVTGLPAAGKSTVAKAIATELDYELLELGEVAKELAEEEVGEEISGQRLRLWTERNLLGEDRDKLFDRTRRLIREKENVVLVGLRTQDDYNYLVRDSKEHELVYVDADFDVRYDRILDRGRGEEADYSPEDLLRRDRKEKSWGVEDIRKRAEVFTNNYYDRLATIRQAEDFAEEELETEGGGEDQEGSSQDFGEMHGTPLTGGDGLASPVDISETFAVSREQAQTIREELQDDITDE